MDYAKLAQTAKRLIEKNGAPMTFSKLGRKPADAAKPWRGPVADVSDPAEATDPISYPSVKAVIVPIDWNKGDPRIGELYGTNSLSQDILARGLSTLYVAEQSFPAGHVSIKTLDYVDDGETKWKIVNAVQIKPGETEIIYQMIVEQ